MVKSRKTASPLIPESSESKRLSAIEAQIGKLRQEADAIRARDVAEVVEKIKVAVAHYGLTAEDLGLDTKRGRKSGSQTSAQTPTKEAKGKSLEAAKTQRPIKFKDDQGNAWVGHGKRPAWFVAALAAGKTAEDMLIKAEA